MASDPTEQIEYEELFAAKEINHLSLGDSILDQPQLFGHCAAWCAILTSQRDNLKEEMENTVAEVDLKIRDHFADTGEKVTESRISAMVRVSGEFRVAQKRYNKSKALASKWTALLESYKQRSYSITQYVNWQSGDYIHERIGTAARESAERARSRRMRQ
jgi:hypothetical protein